MKTETIKISKELYNFLLSHKSADCKSFEEVIWRFIREDDKE